MKRGFARDPGTGNNYGSLLAAQGRFDEAIVAGTTALRTDPANPILIADVARLYHLARRYDESLQLLRRAIQLNPSGLYAKQYLAITLFLTGRKDEAFDSWLSAIGAEKRPELEEKFRATYQNGGWPAVWATYADSHSSDLHGKSFRLWSLISLGRKEETMNLLEALEQERSPRMVSLEAPIFDPVRHEPRFIALMKRVGYPESMWR